MHEWNWTTKNSLLWNLVKNLQSKRCLLGIIWSQLDLGLIKNEIVNHFKLLFDFENIFEFGIMTRTDGSSKPRVD